MFGRANGRAGQGAFARKRAAVLSYYFEEDTAGGAKLSCGLGSRPNSRSRAGAESSGDASAEASYRSASASPCAAEAAEAVPALKAAPEASARPAAAGRADASGAAFNAGTASAASAAQGEALADLYDASAEASPLLSAPALEREFGLLPNPQESFAPPAVSSSK